MKKKNDEIKRNKQRKTPELSYFIRNGVGEKSCKCINYFV